VVGEVFSYVLTVQNVGSDPTSGTVTVTDPMPVGLVLQLPVAAPPGWDCSGSTPDALLCTFPDPIAPGDPPHVFVLEVFVQASAGTSILNVATVDNETDTDISNNSDDDPARILPPPAPAPALSARALSAALLVLIGLAFLALRVRNRSQP
jgi:uncharacterized repeat protein (TIGR01451 family)